MLIDHIEASLEWIKKWQFARAPRIHAMEIVLSTAHSSPTVIVLLFALLATLLALCEVPSGCLWLIASRLDGIQAVRFRVMLDFDLSNVMITLYLTLTVKDARAQFR